MKYYRITKYKFEKNISNEWTSFSDIWNIFEWKKLTKNNYLEIENNYLEVVKIIFNKSWTNLLLIKDLFPYFKISEIKRKCLLETREIIEYLINKIDEKNLFKINKSIIRKNILNKPIKEFKYIWFDEFDIEKNIQIQYKDNFLFNKNCLDDLFRLFIRELIPWSKIYFWKSYIHFWYDMYLYVYCKNWIITNELVSKYKNKWIYIEEWIKSPIK